jgi:hypothetical protein
MIQRVTLLAIFAGISSAYEPKNHKIASDWSTSFQTCADFQIGTDHLNQIAWNYITQAGIYTSLAMSAARKRNETYNLAEYGDNRAHFRDWVFIPADIM